MRFALTVINIDVNFAVRVDEYRLANAGEQIKQYS